jgi:hypothetical protein
VQWHLQLKPVFWVQNENIGTLSGASEAAATQKPEKKASKRIGRNVRKKGASRERIFGCARSKSPNFTFPTWTELTLVTTLSVPRLSLNNCCVV